MMKTGYIGFGSNLGDSVATLHAASQDIEALEGVHLVQLSPLYRSVPVDVSEPQADYLNAVFEIETSLSAEDLLQRLFEIEARYGRQRQGQLNAARTLDLDLLILGTTRIKSRDLTLPHPRLHQRAFVLFPLFDLAPELEIPSLGKVETFIDDVRDQEIERL